MLFFILHNMLYAQQMMSISSEVSADYMVRKILLSGEENLAVTNVKMIGHPEASGIFENKSKYYLMRKGVILSTGRVADAIGPNDVPNSGVPLRVEGYGPLERIATGKTYDATVLSFEFSPPSDSISFNFIFASEEYPEYVKKQVNDIFAFFLENIETGERKNLAVFGRDNTTVNVDNINWGKNSERYIQNAIWDPEDIYQWAEDPGMGELALTYQFDGFTIPMSAGSAVKAHQRYRISFAIADVGDNLFDSAVFLEQGSFSSSSTGQSERQVLISNKVKKALTDQSVEVIRQNGEVKIRLYIQFDFDDDQIRRETDKRQLDEIARMLRIQKDIKLRVEGHTDNHGTDDYNDDLSGRRAFSVATYLMEGGLDVDRLSAYGFGANRPVTENASKQGRYRNRRVELVFY
ncbi:MAG: OmpA family protein [Vicingaceae bacterium]